MDKATVEGGPCRCPRITGAELGHRSFVGVGGRAHAMIAGLRGAMKQPVERRLAAILAADVAGYSRLMGLDEEDTHERQSASKRAGRAEDQGALGAVP